MSYLKSQNIKHWCCLTSLVEGNEFRKEITNAVSQATYFVALMTKDWIDSAECQYEYNFAERLHSRTKWPKIVPIVLESGRD